MQSRYYDAGIGRFINADAAEILMDDQNSLIQYNLFSYTNNNYVVYDDMYGTKPKGKVQWLKQPKKIVKSNQKISKVQWLKPPKRLVTAIEDPGLYDKRNATIKTYYGKRKIDGYTVYTFKSFRQKYWLQTEYNVKVKTYKRWLKYIDNRFGTQIAVHDFFTKLEEVLGDPVWDTDPSVSDFAGALHKISLLLKWGSMPREVNYILRMLKTYSGKEERIYIPYSALVKSCYTDKEHGLFGKNVTKYHYSKREYAF